VVRVQNVFYLLCYAWDHADLRSTVASGDLPGDRVEHLLAHVLETKASELLRRGLHREYLTFDEELRSPRGKIDVALQMKRALRPRGRVACSVDELSHDVALNRILRTTLERVRPVLRDERLQRRVSSVLMRMPPTTPMVPTVGDFASLRLRRVTSHYRFVLRLCELILSCLLPTKEGATTFVDFTGDERQRGLLFEAFVRNFLRHEQSQYLVSRNVLTWDLTPLTTGSRSVLPRMETDITLTRPGRRCVIETKCSQEPLRRGRDDRRRLQEKHLYQLFAYLEHMESSEQRADLGVLLYAAAGERFDHRYAIRGKELRAASLDLDQPWEGVRADLLAFVASVDSVGSAA
jgi:5-methylcytosine-specific restriction enzyme subunit McrC